MASATPQHQTQNIKVIARRRSRKSRYDLEALPKRHKRPASGEPVLEIREVMGDDTLWQVIHIREPRMVTVAEEQKATFFLDVDFLPFEPFALVEPKKGEGVFINFTDKMNGWIKHDDEKMTFKELVESGMALDFITHYTYKLSTDMAVYFDFGQVRYYMRFVDPEVLPDGPFLGRIDLKSSLFFTSLYVLYLLGAIYLQSMPAPVIDQGPPPPPILPEDRHKVTWDYVPKPEPDAPVIAKRHTGPLTMGDPGKVGKETGEHDKGSGVLKKRPMSDGIAGISDLLNIGKEKVGQLFTIGGALDDLDQKLGGGDGMEGLDVRGTEGLAMKGTGTGGGGPGVNIGGLGGRGNLFETGEPSRLPSRDPLPPGGPEPPPPPSKCRYDASTISRVINQKQYSIRSCYQRQLQLLNELSGKVTVKFIIASSGRVLSSRVVVSTMKNANVESCVAKVIRTMTFPAHEGCGVVEVRYPFIFNVH